MVPQTTHAEPFDRPPHTHTHPPSPLPRPFSTLPAAAPLALLVLNHTDPANPTYVRRILFGTQFNGTDNSTGGPNSVAMFKVGLVV